MGAIGDDLAGRHVLAAIRAEGLDHSHARVVAGANAYAEVGLVDGDRQFLGGDAGVSRFRLSDDDLVFLGRSTLIHSSESSYLEDQVGRLARAAPLSFDFSVRRDPAYLEPATAARHDRRRSPHRPRRREAKVASTRIHRRTPARPSHTRRQWCAPVRQRSRVWRQAPIPTQLIDTLGAGDAFIARFLVGCPPRRALRADPRSRRPRQPRRPHADSTALSATAPRAVRPIAPTATGGRVTDSGSPGAYHRRRATQDLDRRPRPPQTAPRRTRRCRSHHGRSLRLGQRDIRPDRGAFVGAGQRARQRGGQRSTAPASAASELQGDITFLHKYSDPRYAPYFESVVNAYMQANPNVQSPSTPRATRASRTSCGSSPPRTRCQTSTSRGPATSPRSSSATTWPRT